MDHCSPTPHARRSRRVQQRRELIARLLKEHPQGGRVQQKLQELLRPPPIPVDDIGEYEQQRQVQRVPSLMTGNNLVPIPLRLACLDQVQIKRNWAYLVQLGLADAESSPPSPGPTDVTKSATLEVP